MKNRLVFLFRLVFPGVLFFSSAWMLTWCGWLVSNVFQHPLNTDPLLFIFAFFGSLYLGAMTAATAMRMVWDLPKGKEVAHG